LEYAADPGAVLTKGRAHVPGHYAQDLAEGLFDPEHFLADRFVREGLKILVGPWMGGDLVLSCIGAFEQTL